MSMRIFANYTNASPSKLRRRTPAASVVRWTDGNIVFATSGTLSIFPNDFPNHFFESVVSSDIGWWCEHIRLDQIQLFEAPRMYALHMHGHIQRLLGYFLPARLRERLYRVASFPSRIEGCRFVDGVLMVIISFAGIDTPGIWSFCRMQRTWSTNGIRDEIVCYYSCYIEVMLHLHLSSIESMMFWQNNSTHSYQSHLLILCRTCEIEYLRPKKHKEDK